MVQMAESQQVINGRETGSAFPFIYRLLRDASHEGTHGWHTDVSFLTDLSEPLTGFISLYNGEKSSFHIRTPCISTSILL